MASYANPRRKPINTSGRRLAEGLSRMGDTFMKDAQASKDKKARDVEEAKQLLDKRQKSADQSFMKGWDTAQSAINVASDSFSDANEDVFRSEVIGLADGKRDQISTWIQEHPDASLIQIDEKINEGTRFLGNLNNTLTNLEAARLQYEAARDLKPGEEGALVPGYNPELIKFFEAQDMNSENMHLTVDDNGGFRISLVDEQELGNTLDTLNEGESLEFTSFNATDMLDNAEINNSGGNSPFGEKGKDGEIIYDQEAIRNYYNNDKLGKAHLNEFATEGNSEGNWMAYGEEVLNDNGELVYSNQFDNYTPEALQINILDGFLDNLPKNKSSKKSNSANSSNSATPSDGSRLIGLTNRKTPSDYLNI